MLIAKPDPSEQKDIVGILDAIDRKIELHRKKRAVLDELFKPLLHQLITGAIRVADLDLSALDAAPSVMPGLVPGIHENKDVDGRDAPGHDNQVGAFPTAEAAQ